LRSDSMSRQIIYKQNETVSFIYNGQSRY
jgi:hypothetical protein